MEKLLFNLTFNEEEINFLLSVLGELPTKSNAYVLITSMQSQIDAQIKKEIPPENPNNEAA